MVVETMEDSVQSSRQQVPQEAETGPSACSSPIALPVQSGCSGAYTPLPDSDSFSPSTGTCTPMSGACTPVASPSRGPSTPIPGRAIPANLSPTSCPLPLPGTSASRLCLNHSDSSSLILPPGYTSALTPMCNFDSKSNLSETASSLLPICRICHMSGTETEVLISPCRCAGTLEYIHSACLMRWLEICSKKSRKPPKCELCHYQYHRHKKFKLNHWRFPRVSRQDKILHVVFIINLLIMVGCAVATVMCFLSDKGRITNFPRNKANLTTEEIITLSCGVLFFVSFFIAMSVQIKAKHTMYQLFVKFIMQNMQWEIDQYDKRKDSKLFKTLGTSIKKAQPSYV